MTLSLTLTRDLDDIEAVVVAVFSDRMDDDGSGLDWAFLAAVGFSGGVGETATVRDDDGTPLVVVGLGAFAEVGAVEIRRAAAAAARAARRYGRIGLRLLDYFEEGDLDMRAIAQAVAEGFVLGSYSFDSLRTEPEPSLIEEVLVDGKAASASRTLSTVA